MLPTTSEFIVLYLQAFAPHLNPRTLMRRLTALKNWHLYQEFFDPTASPWVRKTLKWILNVHDKPKNRASAITLGQLTQMITWVKEQNTLAMWRNNALLQLGFFGAFRASELVSLQFENISFVPEGIDVLIPRSKTDPIGSGQSCAIPYGQGALCPLTALKVWCEKAGITEGTLFRGINSHGKLNSQPLSPQSVL